MKISFWPLSEHQKQVILMSAIFFIICVIHNILHTVKDALIITAEGSGAEVIPFIQLWIMLPMTFVAAFFFTSYLKRYGLAAVINRSLIIFLAFFVIFACFLYPYRSIIEPHHYADTLADYLPQGLNGFIAIGRNWTLSLFFVLGDLWGCVVTSVIFWSLANEITPLQEAKHTYSWVRIGGALGAIIGGQFPALASFAVPHISVYALLVVIICGCVTLMALFPRLMRSFDCLSHKPTETNDQQEMHQNIWQQVRYLFRSRHLLCLAIMVIAYDLVMGLFELVWKAQVKEIYPDFNRYSTFLGLSFAIGGALTVLFAFATPLVLTHLGWTKTALVTPIFLLIIGLLFFGLLIFRESIHLDPILLLTIAVILGAVQFSVGRASKYSLFDISKDMAYIPLESHLKAQGKAAVDGLGPRMGRTGACLVNQGLLLTFTTVGAGISIFAVLIVGIIMAWMMATKLLGRDMQVLVKPGEDESAQLVSVV